MTVISMMFYVLIYISFSDFEDQKQAKIPRGETTCPRSQELKKIHKKGKKGENDQFLGNAIT
jgi:hypothetical protein